MKTIALVAGAITVLASSAPVFAADPLPNDAVRVSFKEPVGDRFVGMFHTIMGTGTVKKHSASQYTFRVGPRGNQNDYAVLFAHLPYVSAVEPKPTLSAAERAAPPVVVQLPASPNRAPGFVPRQLLIKPKAGVDPAAIARFHQEQGAQVKNSIEGIDVYVLALPPNLTVQEAQRRYQASGLVQYAEPNRTMSLPPQPGNDPVVEDNGGAGIYLSPDRLLGDHLLVRYRAGGPVPDLVNQIFGTKTLERTDADELRVSLPPGVNPLVATRMFRLCPFVMAAEPASGR